MGYHSGTPDSASLAAQQAAGQTDLVTPAARVAAEALAAETDALLAVAAQQLYSATLTDADVTVSPGVSKVAEYIMPAATQTTNRAVTVAVTGMTTGQPFIVTRRDRTANTLTIKNGVTGLAVFVFSASPTGDDQATFVFDGVNIVFGVGPVRLA